MKNATSPNLNVTMAGIQFRSPVGVAPIGAHWGKGIKDPEIYAEVNGEILLKHARAGAGYIYIAGAFLKEETIDKLHDRARPEGEHQFPPDGMSTRAIKTNTAVAPYGLEGMYFIPSPFWLSAEHEKGGVLAKEKLMKILKKKKPEDVPIIANTIGMGDLPDTWVDGAKRWEELGADLIEVNVSCPLPTTMRGAVNDFFQKSFPARFQGVLIGDNPDLVEEITRQVVKAVNIPVGVKISVETGFPRVVGLAERIRDAGAKFIHTFNSAVGIAPPNIYDRGKPLWPFMDGSPFCMASGSFLRIPCYRDVAAIARFVPGLDIAAAGGFVLPEHCVEAMMLGARLAQLCTGVIEQGRSLIKQSNSFIRKFMVEQGYQSVEEFIGLGQQYIKYNEDVDMMGGKVVAELDEEKCTKCGRCIDNICTALYSDKGKIKIRAERCAGCGGCMIACQSDAIKLVLRE
ncbi:MAG: tRNA-dihydrouridine synthase [Deltaproteobacteria bacterium]|nr:MAG: tRNA-dihydrouridine synthase [Deltaproteobacteria bacterium]